MKSTPSTRCQLDDVAFVVYTARTSQNGGVLAEKGLEHPTHCLICAQATSTSSSARGEGVATRGAARASPVTPATTATGGFQIITRTRRPSAKLCVDTSTLGPLARSTRLRSARPARRRRSGAQRAVPESLDNKPASPRRTVAREAIGNSSCSDSYRSSTRRDVEPRGNKDPNCARQLRRPTI